MSPNPQHALKQLGVEIVSSKHDTQIQIQIKGLVGSKLLQALQLADQFVASKVQLLLKLASTNSNSDTKFLDPSFGPNEKDINGASAICKNGETIPAAGGSRHQLKLLKLLKDEKLRWERPIYATGEEEDSANSNQIDKGDDADDVDEDEEEEEYEDDEYAEDKPNVFASKARLFAGGSSSGDVIQGNLGDCWFLGAISVLATRMDLLEQVFWKTDQFNSHGLFVCRFMKDFVWNYVIIDDRIPVFGFTDSRPGKPYFARCRDSNELWVPLIEKAYAKLHGSYESLIGGYIDVALNDLSGLCSEQIIMQPGHPGFGEDPFAPSTPNERRGDAFWRKLVAYRYAGTLMGCSIQPPPKGAKVVAEASAGQGLNYKHAYGLIDVGEIQTNDNQVVRLVKLRNPWGMGEWTGAWSDESEERVANQDAIDVAFKVMKRELGQNAYKTLEGTKTTPDEQEEVTEANRNDGTFFMSYEDWMAKYTHFFAGIDFPDQWVGTRVEGKWDEQTCGGNTSKKTWINNPRFLLKVKSPLSLFISVSQDDPRGKDNDMIIPIGFHLCPAVEGPCGNFTIQEATPSPVIPGTKISGKNDDGVMQPAYTFKQAVSVNVEIEKGAYFIIPSMYMRKNRKTKQTNTGRFWISVYGDQNAFELEGGESIAEEDEGLDSQVQDQSIRADEKEKKDNIVSSPAQLAPAISSAACQFEDVKDELVAQALANAISYRDIKREFEPPIPSSGSSTLSASPELTKMQLKQKLLRLGFQLQDLNDTKLNILIQGASSSPGKITCEAILRIFVEEMEEDQVLQTQQPIAEQDDDEIEKLYQSGILHLTIESAKDLHFPLPVASSASSFPLIPFPRIAPTALSSAATDDQDDTEVQASLSTPPASSPSAIEASPNVDTDAACTLHSSSRLQELEKQRSENFRRLQKLKRKACGDKEKLAALPRLIGGLGVSQYASGILCEYCKQSFDNATQMFTCEGSGCIEQFCAKCWHKLREKERFCEECFVHESLSVEKLGMELRLMLIQQFDQSHKLSEFEALFDEMDQDKSGYLEFNEFTQLLQRFPFAPSLNMCQIQQILTQFDQNQDQQVSLEEFREFLTQDQLWQPPPPSTSEDEATFSMERLIDDVLELVCKAGVLKQQAQEAHYSNEMDFGGRRGGEHEQEQIFYERILPVAVLTEEENGETGENSGLRALFNEFDCNGDGEIEFKEFEALLSKLGYQIQNSMEIQMLINRFENQTKNGFVDLQEFRAFLLSFDEQKHQRDEFSLVFEHLKKIPQLPSTTVVNEFCQQLQFALSLDQTQRLALLFTPGTFDHEQEDKEKAQIDDKDESWSENLRDFLQTEARLNLFTTLHVSIEKVLKQAIIHLVFGRSKAYLSEDDLVKAWKWFTPLNDLGLDRMTFFNQVAKCPELQPFPMKDLMICMNWLYDYVIHHYHLASKNSTIDFELFQYLMLHEQYHEFEVKFHQTLKHFQATFEGEQYYLIQIGLSASSMLHFHLIHPILQHHYHLRLYLRSSSTLQLLHDFVQVAGNPDARITPALYPDYDKVIRQWIHHLRLVPHTNHLQLQLMENPAQLQLLRHQFQKQPHFQLFYSISATTLTFAIDPLTLQQQNYRLEEYPAYIYKQLHQAPALLNFLKNLTTLLNVQFTLLQSSSQVEMSWTDFTTHLQGKRRPFTELTLFPSALIKRTPVDSVNGNTPQWHQKYHLHLPVPETEEERLDRQVVFLDIQQIEAQADNFGSTEIPFLGNQSPTNDSRFVIVSVRKTLSSDLETKPYLYCTAYDPLCSTDYQVLGTPEKWDCEFFQKYGNEPEQLQQAWMEIVSNLRIGKALTPKLLLQVKNRLKNCDELVGECEIAIDSILKCEGQRLKDWYPLLTDTTGSCVGYVHVEAQFELEDKKTSTNSRTKGKGSTGKESRKVGNTRPPIVSRQPKQEVKKIKETQDQIQHLQQELRISNEAQEQATHEIQRLRQQLEHAKKKATTTSSSATSASSSTAEVENWKRKYDRLKQQHQTSHSHQQDQISALQTKVDQLQISQSSASIATIQQARLSPSASAHDILQALNQILVTRCPARPYNALKKALVNITDTPDRIQVPIFLQVLTEFGFCLSSAQESTLLDVLDSSSNGLLSLEDFFVKMCGDAATDIVIPLKTATRPPGSSTTSAAAVGSPRNAAIARASRPAPVEALPVEQITKRELQDALPEGWEMRFTEAGRPYYCDHTTRETSWKHPVAEIADRYSRMVASHKRERRLSQSSSASGSSRRGRGLE